MKFICEQSTLNEAVAAVSRAVSSRPSHPVLGNVLLEAQGDRLIVTGFDLAIGIRMEITADVQSDGAITLPAKLLGDIVSRLDGDLTLALGDDNLVAIASSTGRFEIRGIEATEYPALPQVTGEGIELPTAKILEGLRGTLFCASTDETKQVLTGVHIKSVADGLEFAATDGHRLAVVAVGCDAVSDLEVTLPSRALKELEKLSAQSETITFYADEMQAVFVTDSRTLTCRKLDGMYPAYHQLIPKQFSRLITVDRRRFVSGLERVAVLADQKNNLVKLSIDGDRLSLDVEAQDLGNGHDEITAQVTGDGIRIAFNIGYLLAGLKAIPSTEVTLQCNENNQPVIAVPVGESKMTYLVMPVQVVPSR
jgi:DNA polymerase-3 subunit beta